MTVALTDGRRLERSIRNCIGSRGRPMTDAELDAKFHLAAEGVLAPAKTEALLRAVRTVDGLSDAATLARGASSP